MSLFDRLDVLLDEETSTDPVTGMLLDGPVTRLGLIRDAVDEARAEPTPTLHLVLDEVEAERQAQDAKWGGPGHDDQHTQHEWIDYLREHLNRSRYVIDGAPEDWHPEADTYRGQLVRVAALAVAAIEAHDRRAS